MLKENIKLLNLVKNGCSFRTLNQVIERCGDEPIDKDRIINILGNTPTSKRIIDNLSLMNEKDYSVDCLLYFDINLITVEKIRSEYLYLNDIINDPYNLSKLHLQSRTENAIIKACNFLGIEEQKDIKDIILNIVSSNEPIQNVDLKELLYEFDINLDNSEYDLKLDELINERKIKQTMEGYVLIRPNINEYFSLNNDDHTSIVLRKIKGETFEQIASSYNFKKQRAQQIFDNKIKKMPLFNNEYKYFELLNTYKIDSKYYQFLNLEFTLAEYVKLKYELNPSYSCLDYFINRNLIDTKEGKKYLSLNNLVLYNGFIYSDDFIELYKLFLSENNIKVFDFVKLINQFNIFIDKINPLSDCKILNNQDDITIKERKLYNNKLFINVQGSRFIFFNEDLLSTDFIEKIDEYLNNFKGFGSVELFYINNQELCNENNIYDEYDLFAVIKRLFACKYSNKIDFIRNPHICVKGVDKNKFIEELILDLDLPCSVETYVEYVHSVTGIKQSSILANYGFIINQYKNGNGFISLDDDLTKEEADNLENLLNNCECIGTSFFTELVDLYFPDKIKLFLNKNILYKYNYIKTNTSIYKTKYSTRLEAVKNALLNLDFIINKNDLRKICDIEYIYYKLYEGSDHLLVIEKSKDEYLNVVKTDLSNTMIMLRDEIYNSCIGDEIYSLSNFINSNQFISIINSNDEYKEILFSFDSNVIIKFLIMSSKNIYYIETNSYFVFSKEKISLKRILHKILVSENSMTIIELQEVLYDTYGIDHIFSNYELTEMGYYCPYSSEKVYINKEYYNNEMEELLKCKY